MNLLPSLESLTLTGLSLSNHSPLSRTDKFAKLKSLRIVRSTDLDTAAGLLIGHIDRLRHLYLKQISRSRLAEFLIALVNTGSAIESLVMKDLDPSENPLDLSVLSPSTSLRSLTLTSPNTSPDKFWPLTCTRPLATVEHLRLVRVALSETMLWDLPVLFPNLKTLQIEDCSGVSETKANPLQIFSQLEVLDIAYCGSIADEGIAELARLQQLNYLSLLGCCRFSEQAVHQLAAKLPALTEIAAHRLLNTTGEAMGVPRNAKGQAVAMTSMPREL